MVGQSYYGGKNAGGDAFLMQIDPNVAGGSSVLYSTYLGGADQEGATALAVDASGRVIATGYTLSTDFPVTADAAQHQSGGGADAFVTILDPAKPPQSQLVYSTYYGGSDGEVALSVAHDSTGSVYVAGYTFSTDLPVTPDGMQATQQGGGDGFVLKLNPATAGADGLAYSSYVASSGTQIASGVDVTKDGTIYVAGYTSGPLLETIGGIQKQTEPRRPRRLHLWLQTVDRDRSGNDAANQASRASAVAIRITRGANASVLESQRSTKGTSLPA